MKCGTLKKMKTHTINYGRKWEGNFSTEMIFLKDFYFEGMNHEFMMMLIYLDI